MSQTDIAKVDLNLLKGLSVLLAERHVGRAAKRMHVSQSAMSHTLARLREVFSDPLFVRTAKGIDPTPRALVLSGTLAPIMDQIGALLTPEEFEPALVEARFRLQTHSFIISTYLQTFFARIRRLAPGIVFETETISSHSYQQLDNGEVDLVIGRCAQAPARFKQRRVLDEERVCLLARNHPANQNWNINAFLAYPHLKYSFMEEKEVESVTDCLQRAGIPAPKIGFYTHDMQTQPAILSGSDLIAVVPRTVAELSRDQYDLVIQPCPFELPLITVKAIWHERSHNDQLHRWLRAQLIEGG